MNKVLVLSMILCLAVCIGPLFADTADGYSNTFSICNTCGDDRQKPPAATAQSPYDNLATLDRLRGQLHIHSLPDKGFLGDPETPETVAWHYWNAGFHFMALTDHSLVSGPGLGAGAPAIRWAPHSAELTHGDYTHWNKDGHILAIGTNAEANSDLDSVTSGNRVNDFVTRINKVHAQNGLAFIAHPDSWPYAVPPGDIGKIYGRANRRIDGTTPVGLSVDGLGIYHGPGKKNSEGTWDEVLRAGYRIWGYAEDDYHPQVCFDLGRVMKAGNTWIAVPGDTTSDWTYIKTNMTTGNYYVYWLEGYKVWKSSDGIPPRMKVTTDNSGTYPEIGVTLTTANGNPWVAEIKFVDSDGTWDGGTDSWSDFSSTSTKNYVRVTAVGTLSDGRKLHIASQPIWISPYGQQSSSANRLLSLSPELHLRYLSLAEMPPAYPPAGYIGYAFDVTTDSGTCPPGATLDLSYDGEDISAIGGTQYLAIYRYDTVGGVWAKVGGTVDPGTAVITSPITALGYYTISADLPVDTTAPEVFIDNPVTGGVVSADTEVKATVNDDLGAWRVSFFMNGHPLAEDTVALDGWSVNLPIADYCTGDWTVKAVGEDLAGNRGEAEIPIYINSTTPRPTVSITSPGAGANLSGPATATGTCGDDIAVSAVTLYADGTLVGYGELDGSGVWSAEIDTSHLADGPRTLKAVVEDYPGNEATATVSVNLSNGSVSIGSIRGTADGQNVRLGTAVVTAGTAEMGGAFYIEAADRSAGIRVATDKVVPEGAQVSVAGVLGRSNGEREITASDVFVASTGNALPDPLGAVSRTLGGGTFDYNLGPPERGQQGVKDGEGLNNIGLFVRIWGTITAATEGSGCFYMDDGSALNDGSGDVGVKVYGTPPADPVGKRVSVTGVSGAELSGTTPIPVIRTRRAGDVTEVSAP